MGVREVTIYSCDFCEYMHDGSYSSYGKSCTTEFPESLRWFMVNGKLYACKYCGHKLHYFLQKLGLEHEFICTEYSDSPEMGKLNIDPETEQETLERWNSRKSDKSATN